MTGEVLKVLLYYLRNSLHVPYPVAAWIVAVVDSTYSIVTSPVGFVLSVAFLVIGFYRLGVMYVAVLAGVAGAALVEWRHEDWAHYSDRFQYYYMSQIMTASLALCFLATFIGRKLGPKYL